MLALFNRFINFFSATYQPPRAKPCTQTDPDVKTEPPPKPNLAIVLNAITQAASEFVRCNLTPVAEYDPSMGFSIRTIRLLLTPDNSKLLQELTDMNPAVRDKLVITCIRKAQGSAHFKLDDFYGMTLVGNEAILDGQILRVLMFQDQHMAPLTFCFDGEYVDIVREEKHQTAPESAVESAVNTPQNIILPERETAAPSSETCLSPKREPSCKTETRLSGGPSNAIAKLLIRDHNGDEVVHFINQLPFEIGRDLGDTPGYELPETLSLVSRQHLRLVERQGNSLLVENLAAHKNGSFIQGHAQGPRFIWHYSGPSDAWLTLGSRSLDVESIQLRLEAA